jgi:hypothetical protein
MELRQSISSSIENLNIADQLLNNTYPLIREPKLLISVLEHLSQAFENIIIATLQYEKEDVTTLENIQSNFNTLIQLFEQNIINKYNLDKEIIPFILNIRTTLEKHKNANIEFTKKETFIISDNEYNITTLNVNEMEQTLLQSKRYIDNIIIIIKQ